MAALLVGACADTPQDGETGTSAAGVSTSTSTSDGPTSGEPTSGEPTSGGPTGDPTGPSSEPTGVSSSSSGGGGDLPQEPPASKLTLVVLSSRPDMVTGGDALIEVRFPADVAGDEITVLAGGVDVTADFTLVDGARLVGLVEGLALGETVLEASAPGDTPAQLKVANYPRQGPMITGPHQSPFVCRTEASGLGPPIDEDCSVETRYEYFYKNMGGQFVALPDPSQVPGDVQKVAPGDGPMMNYIVRVERGTINRAVYQISTLYDPAAPAWTAVAPQPHWGGKTFYYFRGGCGVGHHQGTLGAAEDLAPFLLADAPVAAGYAVMSSSLNTLGTNCNDVLTSESAMMVKERFIERYGVPRFTMGWGGSGGSMQQHMLAENYPGVLDGIVPMISYPDTLSVYPDIMDCPLMLYYFLVNDQGNFDAVAAQKAASGFASDQTCVQWFNGFGLFEDPTKGCDASIPADQIYHPMNNPDGVRCTLVDNLINILGTDPNTGFARRIYDNVGVQYGLAALNAGEITKEQFLHINEHIGGYGVDGAPVAARTEADADGLRAAYAGGRVIRGDLGLTSVPIIDLRYYTDLSGDIHDRVRSFSTRERLMRANGHFDNHVMIMSSPEAVIQGSFAAFIAMDAWLTALADADQTDLPAAVVATRPPTLTDLCFLDPNMPAKPGVCEAELPIHSSPRMTAGAPLHNDTLKCALRPIDPDDYAVAFTAMEMARLAAAFPGGVCDWAAPGVEQVPALGTWQSFGPRP
jgi:hypothetical protein